MRLEVVRLWAEERGAQSEQAARAMTTLGGREQLVDGDARMVPPVPGGGRRGGGVPTGSYRCWFVKKYY